MGQMMDGARPARGAHVLPDYLPVGTDVNGFRLVRHAN